MYDLTTIQLQNLAAGIVGPRMATDAEVVRASSYAIQKSAQHFNETYVEALESTVADAGAESSVAGMAVRRAQRARR